ncbi:hypothetical protein DU40_19040 [Methanosarcina mazei]|uniref:N-acetyltransferase domain-containing protein n=1 Tax=Methanosarcina mazei TaxID=2209 RepID=A0A0F8DQK0_METMZ|nr:PIN domain-containing protein [Methanosarcina mazei]KKF98034.1 hypothetical protein DU40_19040 [Methanosarcina mazei]
MRVLFDTNIFIYRENHTILPASLQNLHKALHQSKVEILIHPKSLDDLKRDTDEKRRNISLSKINTYPPLESPPEHNKDSLFLELVGSVSKINDEIDNAILYSVYRNAVHFLITEDKGVHKKAIRLGIKDRVLSIEETLEIFGTKNKDGRVTYLPALKDDYVYNLNLNDPFFDSLKGDYSDEFEDWFKKVSREGRRCFVHIKPDSLIGALLIYKVENEPIDSMPVRPARKRLKISTFKVSYVGNKIGELFIKLAVKYCMENNIDEMYLTHFIESTDDYLIDLIAEYGFDDVAKLNKNEEHVFLKKLRVGKDEKTFLEPIKISKRYYPTFYDGPEVNKYVIPIEPLWHRKLFTEYQETNNRGRQSSILEYEGDFIVEGNTIKKAYLCHRWFTKKKISAGDLVLFYRSHDEKRITTIGVAEKVCQKLKDKEEILRLVGKRTVYLPEDIEEIAKKPTTVILFAWHFNLQNPLVLEELINIGALKGAPQTITPISHEKYLMIKTRGLIDERYTTN